MKNLISIPASASLSDALNLFKIHKVSTIAVTGRNFISAGGRSDIFTHTGEQIVGLVSALDLIRLYLENRNLNASVLEAIGESLESQSLWVLEKTASISSLLELFSKGIHSIFLKDNESFEIFTRMDLVILLLENYSQFLQGSITLLYKQVVKADIHDDLLATIKQMSLNQMHALPIIQDGRLVGTISLSDFKEIISERMQDLSLEYFKNPGRVQRGTCDKNDSIETVLKKIKDGHIHRLWIVDNSKVAGVVSLSDIFADLLKNIF
jgi:CBS domain-containing protein